MFEARPLVDYCVSFVMSNLDVFLSTTLELKQHVDSTSSDSGEANAMLHDWVDVFKSIRDGRWHDDETFVIDDPPVAELAVSVSDVHGKDSMQKVMAQFDMLFKEFNKVS